MAGATIELRFTNERQIQRALRAMAAIGERPEVLLEKLGPKLVSNTQDRFSAGRDPAGNRWAPLSPAYLPHKPRGSILIGAGMYGGLQGFMVHAVSGDTLAVGNNKVYAAVHQFGATIRPKKAGGRLFFRDGGGNIWGAAREVTIPARPYLGLSAIDREDIFDLTETEFERAIALAGRPSA